MSGAGLARERLAAVSHEGVDVTEVTPWLSVRSGAVIHLWMPAEWGAFRWEWAGETAISAVLASTGG